MSKTATIRKADTAVTTAFALPEGLALSVVENPIPIPIISRGGRKGTGIYAQILASAMKMRPTTIETGLAPHFEWPAESHKQLRSRMIALSVTKKKNADKFDRVFFMQRSNPEKNTYTIYIWRE